MTKQQAGGLIAEGSKTGTEGVHHQVHLVGAAEDVNAEGGAGASSQWLRGGEGS